MKINIDKKFKINNKEIIYRQSQRGWAIVIMPNKILIDNYEHGYAHIHPDRKEIKTESLNETLNIVIKHIEIHSTVELKKLRKELIK